ncbi:hypothetical protein ACLBYN_31365, partial [Pseudomonas aeruginosa]
AVRAVSEPMATTFPAYRRDGERQGASLNKLADLARNAQISSAGVQVWDIGTNSEVAQSVSFF